MKSIRVFLSCGLFAAAFALAGGPARADLVYECKMAQKAQDGGWIPEVVAVVQPTGGGTPTVFDPIIKFFLGGPIPARIDVDNDKRTTFTWDVKAKSSSLQNAKMHYRLTIRKADKTATMTASPIGFSGDMSADGRCKASTKKK